MLRRMLSRPHMSRLGGLQAGSPLRMCNSAMWRRTEPGRTGERETENQEPRTKEPQHHGVAEPQHREPGTPAIGYRLSAIGYQQSATSHQPPSSWVLNDFSLNIPAGQTLAVVGHTGAGKS